MSTPPEAPVRLRLSSPADILAAVPYLLGFSPQQSLVVICLHGKEIKLTMRVDIGSALELRAAFAERLLRCGGGERGSHPVRPGVR